MITHIRTKGFKGFDIDEDVPEKVIYTGANRSGKSARAGAIAIALYGHIPFSTAGKRPGDILDSFGNETLVCAVTIGGHEFARKFSRNEKGTVSQRLQFDGKMISTENFAVKLSQAGSPKIADVAEFMKQSEAKKVETLFDLFPNPELSTIDTEIDDARADVSKWTKKRDDAEATIKRLTKSKDDYEVLPGSIAEIQAEIKTIETQISETENEIKQAEIEEAKAEAKKEAEDKAISDAMLNTEKDWEQVDFDSMPSSPEMVEIDKTISAMEAQTPEPFQSTLQTDVSFSIKKIIDAMTQTGCGACAALIVAKQELKKYE